MGWKNGSRPAGVRCDMRISRVVSWYTMRERERVVDDEGDERGGEGRERWKEEEREESDGRRGWAFGEVRERSQWSLFIGPTVYAEPAVPIGQ